MRKTAVFLLGAALALAVNSIASVQRPRVESTPYITSDGYLAGWSVTWGEYLVCDDPYVSRSTREIECE